MNDNANFGFNINNIVDYTPKEEKEVSLQFLMDAYPKEKEKVVFHDPDMKQILESESDRYTANFVAKDENDGKVIVPINDYTKFHPNPIISDPNSFRNPYWSNNYYFNNYISPSNLYMRSNMFAEGYHNMSQATQYARTNTFPTLERGSNIVDFSNPDSVARSQNLFGYGNHQNPNIITGSSCNPYEYNPKTSYSSWYNPSYGFNQWNWNYSRLRPVTSEEDAIKIIIGKKKEIPKLKPIKKLEFKIVQKEEEVPVKEEEVKEKKEEKPKQYIIPQETQLIWTGNDDKKVEDLAERISVYNSALAYVVYNIPCMNNITAESYKFIMEVVEERLNEYIQDEKDHPDLDYRLPYRYRKLPEIMKTSSGRYTHNMMKIEFVPEKKYDDNGNRIYDYDRGREPNKEEWKLFYSRALKEVERDVLKKRYEWIVEYNTSNHNYDKYKNDIKLDDYYSPYDTLGMATYNLKKKYSKVNDLRWFYRKALDTSVTDQEFDDWWSGKTLQSNNINPALQSQAYIKRCNGINMINQLQNVKIVDQKVIQDRYFGYMSGLMDELTGGCFNDAKNLNDVFAGFGRMDSRYLEIELEKQNKQCMSDATNKYSFRRTLMNFNNTPNPSFNNNFRPGSVFGHPDPKYGFPSNYVDLTNTDGYNERKQQFLNYCANNRGSSPLRPIYM